MHGLPRWLSCKEYTCQAGDTGLTPGLGRSPGEENGNPLQDSCLGNPMDRGAWQATVHGWGHMELDMTERLNHNKYIPCNMPATGAVTGWDSSQSDTEDKENQISRSSVLRARMVFAGRDWHQSQLPEHWTWSVTQGLILRRASPGLILCVLPSWNS